MKIPQLASVKLLGDPHLGKRFRTGVPLHRRGERERHQWQVFLDSLTQIPAGVSTHVNMGDQFDDYVVDNATVWRAAVFYIEAAKDNPDVTYIIHIGNHDASKDADKISSFQVFAGLVAHVPNIRVVMDDPYFHDRTGTWHLPWTPFKTSRETAKLVDRKCVAAFGHWDHRDFGDENHTNVVPVEELWQWTHTFVSGHEHTPGIHPIGPDNKGLLYLVGSMLPYSFGEDPKELIYVIRDLEDVEDINDYKDKALRLHIPHGAVVPEGWSDVPLQFQPVFERVDTVADVETISDFSFEGSLAEVMGEFEVSDTLTETLLERFKASRKDI